MSVIRKTIPSLTRRLSLQVFERFCSEYWRRLLVAGRGDLEFVPEEWWGRPDGDGVWLRAATVFSRQSEPWPEFVQWLFKADVDGRSAKLPEPAWLCSRPHRGAFFDDYAAPANQEVLRHRVLQELRQQQTQFDMAVQDALDDHELKLNIHDGSRSGVRRRALLTAEITPLLACCVALKEGLTDVAREFREAAWDQYWPYGPLYNEIWGGLIPPELKSEYTKILNQRKGGA